MKKRAYLLALMALLTASSALAWQERGNGGDAIRVGGRLYSLDLYENGVERQPSYRGFAVNPQIEKELRAALRSERFPLRLLAVKLTQMHSQDPMFAWYVVRAMERYNWVFVNGPLTDIADEQDLVVEKKSESLVQAAIRSKAHIRISYPVWKRLDKANQAALVLHEIVYALTWPSLKKEENEYRAFQDSSIARRVIGFWFSDAFDGKQAWNKFVNSAPDIKRHIPHSNDTNRLFSFRDPYARTEEDFLRNRWVRVGLFAGKNHGKDYVKMPDGTVIPSPEELCAAGVDNAYIADIRPRIVEAFTTDPGGYEHEPYEGLPKKAPYPLGWISWDPNHWIFMRLPAITPDYGGCEGFLRRIVPTEPFSE